VSTAHLSLTAGRGPGSDPRRPWLLIEDDTIDDVAFRRAAKQAGLTAPIVTTPTIDTALVRLLQAPRPRLIILDLNLPGRGGLDALGDLRHHGIPIVILTTSRDERDVARAHASGIAGFFAKPLDRQAYQDTVTLLVQYWNRAEVAP